MVERLLTMHDDVSKERDVEVMKYRRECTTMSVNDLVNDEPARAAKMALTISGFKYWELQRVQSRCYEKETLYDGTKIVRRSGNFESPGRVIPPDERCSCDDRRCLLIQCRHEMEEGQGEFLINLWDTRYIYHPRTRSDPLGIGTTSCLLTRAAHLGSNEEDDTPLQDDTPPPPLEDTQLLEEGLGDEDQQGILVGDEDDGQGSSVQMPPATKMQRRGPTYNDLVKTAADTSRVAAQNSQQAMIFEAIPIQVKQCFLGQTEKPTIDGTMESVYNLLNDALSTYQPATYNSEISLSQLPVSASQPGTGRPVSHRLKSRVEKLRGSITRGPAPVAGSKRPYICSFCSAHGHNVAKCPQ
jgi:hypothetical protein